MSLALGERGQLMMRCHRNKSSGCRIGEILSSMELTFDDLFQDNRKMNGTGRNGHQMNGTRRIAATYDYRDEIGDLLFQAVRFEPKDFCFRRPVDGGWVWNLQGVRRVLYRFQDLLNYFSECYADDDYEPRLVIVEGEKDADNCWKSGVQATTSPMGSGNWCQDFNATFKGCRVAIIVDNDPEPDRHGKFPGIEHANLVASSIYPYCSGVKILTLPGDGKDFSDWLGKINLTSKEDVARSFWDIVRAAPHWHPPRPVSEFEELVSQELGRARQEYTRPFSSIYEGAGVLVKEFEEFKVELARKTKSKSQRAILNELVQLAAMCRRLAEDKLGVKK